MRTCVLAAAAALVVAGALTGCERAIPGTVAMTTEPGASGPTFTIPSTPRTTTPRTSIPGTSTPRTSAPRTSTNAAPPSDAATMTCEEYLTLDPDAQTAVIVAILNGATTTLGPENAEIAKSLADAVCTFLPQSPVSDILTGGTP